MSRRVALKAFLGFLAGLALWATLSRPYEAVLAKGAEVVLRTFEKPSVTRLEPAGETVKVNREDFDPRSPRPGLPVKDLTFNVILLTALFATEPRPFSDRNVPRFLLALLVLMLTHVLALVVEVMSIYVAKLGPWSRVHYSDFERNIWGVASHSYRVVLMYAIAFGLWWIFRPGPAAEKAAKKKRRG